MKRRIKNGDLVRLKPSVNRETLNLMGIITEAQRVIQVLGPKSKGAVVTEIIGDGLCRFNEVIVYIPDSFLERVKVK